MPRPRTGFSLPEVLVSIVLLAMAVTILGQTVANSIRAHTFSQQYDPHSWPMRKLREAILSLPSREDIESGGELEISFTIDLGQEQRERDWKIRWEAEIYPTNLLNVYQVDVQATLEAGDAYSEVREFHLIAYRPNWSDPEETPRIEESIRERTRERLTARGQESMMEEPEGAP